MNKFSKICLASILSLSTALAFAAGIDEAEIKTVADQVIVFENYTGPHSKVDTLDQIKGIGTGLAANFDKNIAGNYGNSDRYYVVHAVDSSENGKLEADIFIVGKDATVDHVRNLRHIIASYLAKAYGYEYNDAYTVATFVTVYNAVYRGKLDYFGSKYKNVVMKVLTSEKAGLSTSYKEWPGASQIVIPLADVNGGLSSVDTSVISDKKVVESMQEEDDKGIDERKNMVDIKEREAEKATEKAQEAQKTATQEEKKTEAAASEKKAEEAQKKADEAQEKAKENPNDKAAQKEAAETKKEAEEAKTEAAKDKKEVQKQEEAVKEQEKKTEEAKSTAKEEQEKADKKNSEAQSERTQIAKDQKEVIQNSILEETTAIYALKLVDSKNLYSAITKVNRLTAEELKTSKVKVLRNRTMYTDGTNFIAIAGENGKTSAIKLVQLDKTNLEIIKESEEVIAESSILLQAGTNYYAVINDNSKYYLGKFNSNLECLNKSDVEVQPGTPVVICAEGLCVTDKSGKIVILNAGDLTQKKETTAGKTVNAVKGAASTLDER